MTNAVRLEAEEQSVLIISSHLHLRNHYAQIIQNLQVQVFAVGDGFEALEFLRQTPVHTVFADFFLPGINALELFLLMKELHFPIPFVICSSELSARSRSEALQIGVSSIVRKPTFKRTIENCVREAIETRESQMLKFFC